MALSNNVNKLSREINTIRDDLKELIKGGGYTSKELKPYLARITKVSTNSANVKAQLISGIGTKKKIPSKKLKNLWTLYQQSNLKRQEFNEIQKRRNEHVSGSMDIVKQAINSLPSANQPIFQR